MLKLGYLENLQIGSNRSAFVWRSVMLLVAIMHPMNHEVDFTLWYSNLANSAWWTKNDRSKWIQIYIFKCIKWSLCNWIISDVTRCDWGRSNDIQHSIGRQAASMPLLGPPPWDFLRRSILVNIAAIWLLHPVSWNFHDISTYKYVQYKSVSVFKWNSCVCHWWFGPTKVTLPPRPRRKAPSKMVLLTYLAAVLTGGPYFNRKHMTDGPQVVVNIGGSIHPKKNSKIKSQVDFIIPFPGLNLPWHLLCKTIHSNGYLGGAKLQVSSISDFLDAETGNLKFHMPSFVSISHLSKPSRLGKLLTYLFSPSAKLKLRSPGARRDRRLGTSRNRKWNRSRCLAEPRRLSGYDCNRSDLEKWWVRVLGNTFQQRFKK